MTKEVDAVSLKLPTFWTSTPTTWFAQAEAQFIVRNITNDDTKYYYVVAALDSSTANRAKSLLVAPPTNNKYDAIKKFLTSAYELSNYERATALFNLAGLGDSKPSELMDTMLGLMGDNKPCILFHHLFLQQLPTYVRSQLHTETLQTYVNYLWKLIIFISLAKQLASMSKKSTLQVRQLVKGSIDPLPHLQQNPCATTTASMVPVPENVVNPVNIMLPSNRRNREIRHRANSKCKHCWSASTTVTCY